MSIIMISLSVTGLLSFLLIVLFLILENVSMQKKVKALSEKINNLKPEINGDLQKINCEYDNKISDIEKNYQLFEERIKKLENNKLNPSQTIQTDNQKSVFPNKSVPPSNEKNFKEFIEEKYGEKSNEIMMSLRRLKNKQNLPLNDDLDDNISSICLLLRLNQLDNDYLKLLANHLKTFFIVYFEIIFPVIGDNFDNEIMEPAKILGGNNKVQSVIQFGIKYKNEIIKKAVVYVQ